MKKKEEKTMILKENGNVVMSDDFTTATIKMKKELKKKLKIRALNKNKTLSCLIEELILKAVEEEKKEESE